MNFSAWSIRNPIAPLLVFFILIVLGWQSFNALPITRFPNIDVPLVSVTMLQSGAAPAELERQITKEIEDAVAGLTGVKNIVSTVNDGTSNTVVEFRMEVPTAKAVQDVKDAIDRIRGQLPGNAEPPIINSVEVEGQAIITMAVVSPDLSLDELSWFVDDVVKRELQGRRGIGRVERYGGADREIRIELDPMRLASFGITAQTVSGQVRATNADVGSGRGEVGDREQAIRVLGDARSAVHLSETTIAVGGGRFVRLGDLGTIRDTFEEPRVFARFNGDPVVTFAVFRSKGASEVSVDEQVKEALTIIRAAHPSVQIKPVDDSVFYTYGNYESALHTLIEGAALAVLVVLLFLRNWRATLISAVALPLSAIPTFWVMDLMGFSLNLVSFLAITLATGILVDDAIVEIENIARHMRMGKSPYRAAIDAADEIGLAVIATTFTIAAVFIPVSFMSGIPGQYFRQFGLTVAVAVLFSLLVARLITPLMAAYLMRPSDALESHEEDGPLTRWYTRQVGRTLRHPYMTLAGAVAVLAASLYFMLQIPGSFIPPEDVGRIQVSVELPPGSTLGDTEKTTEVMRQQIIQSEGVQSVFVLGGSSPTGERNIRRASLVVILQRIDHSIVRTLVNAAGKIPVIGWVIPEMENPGRTRAQNEIAAEIFEKLALIPDVRAYKLNDRGQRDIAFNLLSDNDADLNSAVSLLETRLRSDPLLAQVSAEGALPRPEVQVTPREQEAARLGISTRQIADIVRIATIGDVDAALAKVSVGDRLIPVRVQVTTNVRGDLSRIGALRVPAANGSTVPLAAVAEVRIAEGPSTINRFNRQRRATLGASLPPGVALNTATARFNEIIRETKLPAAVKLSEAGDAEVQQELTASFGKAMVLGLMLVLTVLILLFKDVLQPFTILFSLPLSIGGVAAALILTNNPISMPVLIGMLMLMGIVTKNAILLVDFAVEKMRVGEQRIPAMIDAGRKRAQPIIMTSIAMSAGMLPSALGVGEGGAFRAPMATAVIGGIIVSTVLSLIVVPSFFLIMDDASRLLGRLFKGLVGPKEEEPDALEPAELTLAMNENREQIKALRAKVATLGQSS
ncbi:MAG: efflux RND transporter permease subunit [Burkholderiaceae bacterium]